MLLTKDIIRMLYIRFANLWGDRFTNRHTPDILEIWYEDWLDGLQGIDPACFKEALKYCKENLDWSPSMAEFIKICDRSLNIPDPRECMEMAINKDFSHPIVKDIYDCIGSWDMKSLSSEKLLKCFNEIHKELMTSFRRQRSLTAQPLTLIEGNSHGSEVSGNNHRGTGVQQAAGYLF